MGWPRLARRQLVPVSQSRVLSEAPLEAECSQLARSLPTTGALMQDISRSMSLPARSAAQSAAECWGVPRPVPSREALAPAWQAGT